MTATIAISIIIMLAMGAMLWMAIKELAENSKEMREVNMGMKKMFSTMNDEGAGKDELTVEGIAQAIRHLEKDRQCFAFVGDSTFFASAIPGVVNAVYNQAEFTLIVLDNSTTAMTGHQPHPGTGKTAMGQAVDAVSIESVLRGIGVQAVETVDPLDHALAVETVKRVSALPGVKAVIFKSPCVVLAKPQGRAKVDADKCVGCKKCIRELGCPALSFAEGKAAIDAAQCVGCSLCAQICPVSAISGGEAHA